MTRSLLALAIALLAACGIVVASGGWHGVRLTVEILLPVGLLALLAAHAVERGRPRMSSLRSRFQLGVGLALGQLLVALVVGAALMFVSQEDAWTTIAILAFAAIVAGWSARIVLAPVTRDVAAIGAALESVEQGERPIEVTASSGREMEGLARSANRMIGALEAEERSRDEADAARRQLVAAVSHDLRTPLTSLRLIAQALNDDLVDGATARGYVRTMDANVRTLGALIDDLFEFARLDAGDFALVTEAVPLQELVPDALEAMRAQALERGVDLRAEIGSGLAPALGDREQLGRVLANLMQNAIRHTPPDGSVVVRAGCTDGSAQIEVADTGEGIAPEDAQRVFEPFFRGGADAARTSSGTGLGLAIARAIVEAHGGRIWLAEADSGTRVCFSLPLAPV